ncbi:Lrp/AsnC family transcriptional regulator [Limosilactobacillus caccae]|uniref:Lrp/AsnC family transcriptional regulator n=1 Tax=Limosilactobacillus caccae TaxID=1926284 RepID=UPI000970A8C7|nr:Lrp/AsnC family transcriptional regulator [Limosilactobacillus caccae]
MEIDNTDKQILKLLSENGRMKIAKIANEIHMSAPATKARILKLEDNGVISHYTIEIDHTKLGYHMHTFLHFSLKTPYSKPFLDYMKEWDEHFIQQCSSSGNICYIVEARFHSQEELWKFLSGVSKYAHYQVFPILKASEQNTSFSTWASND